jgi:hypothetical protein
VKQESVRGLIFGARYAVHVARYTGGEGVSGFSFKLKIVFQNIMLSNQISTF